MGSPRKRRRQALEISLAEVQEAKNEIHQYFPASPMLHNPWLSEALGCEVHLKLESMLPIGSFKIRGATHRISRLSAAEKKRGVIAASAGNHAQGVAWASREVGTHALIVMPTSAPLTKIQNTRALGAEIVLEGDNFDEAFAAARKLAKKTGRTLIHAFEDSQIIAGQGTVGLEILEQLPDVDVVIGPIGGGGLMAGIGTVIRELRPQTRIIGCQASGASAMVKSLKQGKIVHTDAAATFADGIAVREASPRMRLLLDKCIDEVVEESDEAIANAVLTLLEKAKIMTEGAGALSLAALEKIHKHLKRKKVVVVISGGNIDVNLLGRIIDRGLIRAGRRVRVNVLISDKPGSLAKLTDLIARQGANVLQAIHDRNEPSTMIDQTEVALTLETRGHQHSREVIRALREHVLRLELTH